jgi:hypothetical protein
MTEGAIATTTTPAATAAPAVPWSSARPHLVTTLRALNVLSAALPESGHFGSGTRRQLASAFAHVDTLLTMAGAPTLLPYDGTVFWPADATPVSASSLMGQAAPAALDAAARELGTRALARAEEQVRAIELYLAGLATRELMLAYFLRWENAISFLLTRMGARELAAGAVTTAGRVFVGWLADIDRAIRTAWGAFQSALNVSAAVVGGLPIILIIVALILLSQKKKKP